MTTTAQERPIHIGTHATADERRDALLELADLVDTEDRRGGGPLSRVLKLIVPTLAGANCADPLGCFNSLVGAVAELARYTSNEDDWLAEHELGRSAEVRANVYERLQSNVDFAADRCMGRQS